MTRVHRVPVEELALGLLELGPEASKYVCKVLRVLPGDNLELFEPLRAEQAAARVVRSEPGRVVCDVERIEPASSVPEANVCLLQGMSRGERVERVIRDATALGVSRIVISSTDHGVLPAPVKGDVRLIRWQRIAVEAARQSGRGNIPELAVAAALQPALAEVKHGLKLCLDPTARVQLVQALVGWEVPAGVAIAVGPEGGFSPREYGDFESQGWQRVGLGSLVLRTELAPIVALSQIAACAVGGSDAFGL